MNKGLSRLLTKQKIESKVRTDFASMLMGNTNSKLGSGSPMPSSTPDISKKGGEAPNKESDENK